MNYSLGMGRKTTYTSEIGQEICDRLAEGEPLQRICRDDHMPAWRTVYLWMEKDEAFVANIARSREVGFDAIAEDCLDIADDGTNDRFPNGQLDTEHVARSKLRIYTRLQLLAKWSPKKYGERLELAGKVDMGGALAERLAQGRNRTGAD